MAKILDLGSWILATAEIRDRGSWPWPRYWILATTKILHLGHVQDLGSLPRRRSWILDTAKIKHTRNITNNSKHKSKTMYGQWGMGPPLREHEVVPTLREVVGLAIQSNHVCDTIQSRIQSRVQSRDGAWSMRSTCTLTFSKEKHSLVA